MRGFHFFIAMNNITFFSYTTCFFTHSSVNGISIGRLQNTSYDLTGNITSFGLVLSREAGGKVICQSWVGHATGESGKSGERALNRKFLIHSLHSFIAQLLKKKQRDTNKWFPQCFPFPQWLPQWFESASFHSLVFLTPLSGNFYYCVIKTLLFFFLKIIIEKIGLSQLQN